MRGEEMSQIVVKDLTFCYEGSLEKIFEKVSVTLDTNWKLGMIGRNGKGKTTFLQLLLGKYPYQGEIYSNVSFSYFPFSVENKEDLVQEMCEKIAPEVPIWKIQKELSLLKMEDEVLGRTFSTLSQGEQTKVLLAILFSKENEFLLLDEPTNHLDQSSRRAVANYLKYKKGFLLVSHDRKLLDEVVDHILSINNTNIELQRGNFTSWKENRERQDHFEQIQKDKLQREIGKLTKAAQDTKQWSNSVEQTKWGGQVLDKGYVGHMSAKMMKRSKVIQNRVQDKIQEKTQLLKEVEQVREITIKPLPYSKSTYLVCNKLQIGYETKPLFPSLSFELIQTDRIAIIGKNGSGKSSLLKLVLQQPDAPDVIQGQIRIGEGLILSYVPQSTENLKGTIEQLAQQSNIPEFLLKSMLFQLGVQPSELTKQMQHLSLGQKKKILLARSLCQRAHVYIWDEPFNDIDIITRMQMEQAILKNRITMMVIEHDEAFIDKVATKKIVLS